jgi:hypothetical protein
VRERAVKDDAPFRRPGMGVSPVLAQLAEAGGDRRREMPRDAEAMAEPERRRRLERVFKVNGHDASGLGLGALLCWTIATPLCGAISAQDGKPVAIVFGAGTAIVVTVWAMIATPRRAEERRAAVAEGLAWATRQPFPVSGYELWCLSEIPLLDVVLTTPVAQRQLADAVAAVDPTIEVDSIDERTARLHIPPRTVTEGDGPAEWYADPAALLRVFDKLLLPLHTDVPIERVDMGGAMHKR